MAKRRSTLDGHTLADCDQFDTGYLHHEDKRHSELSENSTKHHLQAGSLLRDSSDRSKAKMDSEGDVRRSRPQVPGFHEPANHLSEANATQYSQTKPVLLKVKTCFSRLRTDERELEELLTVFALRYQQSPTSYVDFIKSSDLRSLQILALVLYSALEEPPQPDAKYLESTLGKIDYRLIEQMKAEMTDMQEEIQSYVDEIVRVKETLASTFELRIDFGVWVESVILVFTNLFKALPALGSHIEQQMPNLSLLIKEVVRLGDYYDEVGETCAKDWLESREALADFEDRRQEVEDKLQSLLDSSPMIAAARNFLKHLDTQRLAEQALAEVRERDQNKQETELQ